MKILTVVGARPQFIKAAVISRELKKRVGVREIMVHTGQHFDHNMSDTFFGDLDIPRPNYQLNINQLSHAVMTAKMMIELESIIIKEKPDVVLVYGDTNSTLAGAITSAKLNVPLAHVESGLRSFNVNMPEEINRIITDRLSNYLYCPTKTALINLQNEGIKRENGHALVCGDVMYDSVLFYLEKARAKSEILSRLNLKEFVLCTVHREENTGNESKLRSIFKALEKINEEIEVVLPLHPRTRRLLDKLKLVPSFTLIDPVGYIDMLKLIDGAKLILTDSGGLQKEAYFLMKPCVTLREETEWIELVESGANQLSGSNTEDIIKAFVKMINHRFIFDENLFGNGDAAIKVVDDILNVEI